MDELAKDGNFIVVNPETLQKLKDRGLPIESKFIPYKDYLEKLFAEKRKVAESEMNSFPALSDDIGNAAISSLYEEIRECYAFGLYGAVIILSIILLEISFKYVIFNERKLSDPNSKWEDIESLNFISVINNLSTLGKLSPEEKAVLVKFNVEIRNPYIHYNLQKLVADIGIEKLPMINTETAEVETLTDVKLTEHPSLWFAGKKHRDKTQFKDILNFCMDWANRTAKM
jgi:hypothetical protein